MGHSPRSSFFRFNVLAFAMLYFPACMRVGLPQRNPADLVLSDADCMTEFTDLAQSPDDVPHPNEVEEAEHAAAEALVDYSKVTAIACRSGNWSSPDTWKGSSLPVDGARVLIMPGRTVAVDGITNARPKTIRVDGILKFAETVNTKLVVETMFVSPTGSLIVGTQAAPIAVGATATVTIADAPIDLKEDPLALGHGIIVHGAVNVYGAEKTSYVSLTNYPKAGDTNLVLDESPAGWQVGDRLVFPGTDDSTGKLDEELTIKSISGSQLTVNSLKYEHSPNPSYPQTLKVYLANLSRNVIFESENKSDVTRRGHFMVMHSPRGNLNYAAFNGLGRTLTQDANLNYMDADHKVVCRSGGAPVPCPIDPVSKVPLPPATNPKGRYAVHFHRTGIDLSTVPNTVTGCVVEDSLRWGYVNHSSFVNFDNNIAYHGQGVQFQTEAGNEIGAFRGNLAIRTTGNGDDLVPCQATPLTGVERGDSMPSKETRVFGTAGNGFWFEGSTLTITGNIAIGHPSGAFVFYPEGIVEAGIGTIMIPVENLTDKTATQNLPGNIGNGRTDLWVTFAPFNVGPSVAYNSYGSFILSNSSAVAKNIFTGLLSWGAASGFATTYTVNATFKDSSFYGEQYYTGYLPDWMTDLTLDNVHMEQFAIGAFMPNVGQVKVIGGSYANGIDFYINHPNCGSGTNCSRSISFEAVQSSDSGVMPGWYYPQHYTLFYPGASNRQMPFPGYQMYDKGSPFYMASAEPYAWNLFLPDQITWKDTATSAPMQVFYSVQTPSFVFPSQFVIPQFQGLPAVSLQQGASLQSTYHLMIGGSLPAGPTTSRTDFLGLVLGSPVTMQDDLQVDLRYPSTAQPTATVNITDHTLPQTPIQSKTFSVLSGWNLISATDGTGAPRTLLLPGPSVGH